MLQGIEFSVLVTLCGALDLTHTSNSLSALIDFLSSKVDTYSGVGAYSSRAQIALSL